MQNYNERVWNAQHNGFAFLSFAHNSGNYAFIVSHDFQAEKIAAAARRRQVLFWWFRVLSESRVQWAWSRIAIPSRCSLPFF